MTKFHITKRGIPTECKVLAGVCPLGGEDSHFTTLEEAEEKSNELNKNKILAYNSPYKTIISKESFNTVFVDPYGDVENRVIGTDLRIIEKIKDGNYIDTKEFSEVYNSLPQRVKKLKETKEFAILIKEKDLKEYFTNMFDLVINDNNRYKDMIYTIEQEDSNLLGNEITQNGNRSISDINFLQDLINHSISLAKIEFNLIINEQYIFIETNENYNKNWVEEYFISGRYEIFNNQKV